MSETQPDLREALARAIFERGRKQGGIDPETWEVAGDEMQAWLLGHADAMIAGPFAPILAQVSALQAEVERLQKVEGEREKDGERVPSGPCWSDKPEPVPVSALRATITSRRALELVTEMVAAEDRHVTAVNTHNAEHRSQSSRGIFPLRLRPEQIECDAARKNWYDTVRKIVNEGRQLTSAFAPCDRSGEAGETSGLDPQGESTVTGAARQAPSDPMQEVVAEIVERAGRDPAQAFLRETIARRDAERQAPSDNPLTETKEGSEHV